MLFFLGQYVIGASFDRPELFAAGTISGRKERNNHEIVMSQLRCVRLRSCGANCRRRSRTWRC